MPAKYAVGIDLGTTNSVLACVPLVDEHAPPDVVPIPQLVAAGTTEESTSLPSFLYLATDQEAESGSLAGPWQGSGRHVVGQFARQQSADVPDRTVAAAKSWLAHSRVNRHDEILPWDAPAEVPRISPVFASRCFLEHLVAAWQHAYPDAPLAEQVVVLTVPASFDAAARELTREAALAAGLPASLVLLEEPQAALYAWLSGVGDRWRKQLKVDETVLVCDVGGGTTDLTLVSVAEEDGQLHLRREAVGNHLLVGGDNMDLTLAHFAAARLAEKGVDLDPWQSVSLWHSCRQAKEKLLSGKGAAKHTISVLGRGSKLIGGTVKVEVERAEVQQLLMEGFLPACGLGETPLRRSTSGFQTIGLPYEADTAITRHLAAFLSAHGDARQQPVHPQHLLVNGGVFKAGAFRQRLLEVLASWSAGGPPRLLSEDADLDHAVARGAAYYGWAKQHGGVRIRGGTARSYYVGIERSGLAIPGAARPLDALCVVPFGMEEGTEVDVPSDEIGLVVGQPAHFRFFSSPVRKEDGVGQVLRRWSPDELQETDSLEATLPPDPNLDDTYVPVKFHSRVTELGMFELWCVSSRSDQRWKLEFSVREED
ncbi:MAG: Hsp70 family protein [Pirellulaceae bacterium]|nr:Hsp70 family protein [Pirellulaceae bacterium]